MFISAYTSGGLRRTLPEGILHDTYLLHEDQNHKLHADVTCSMAGNSLQIREVPSARITSTSECACLSISGSSPPEFQALALISRWHAALQAPAGGEEDFELLYEAWHRTFGMALALRRELERLAFPGGTEALRSHVEREAHMLHAGENHLRHKLMESQHILSLRQLHAEAEGEDLPSGNYLVAHEGLGLTQVSSWPKLTLTLLHMDHSNIWRDGLLAEVDAQTLSLYLLLLAEQGRGDALEDGIAYIRLEESDTPAIREIAKTLWDPHNPLMRRIETALDAARNV